MTADTYYYKILVCIKKVGTVWTNQEKCLKMHNQDH